MTEYIESIKVLRQQLLSEDPQFTQKIIDHNDFSSDDPRHMPRMSLEQQKKQAKELLKALKAGDSSALDRAHEVGLIPATGTPNLANSQHIIAKELGFTKWTDLKNHIDAAAIAQQAIKSGEPSALDAKTHALHIRCGSDIKHGLAIAGFCGDFLEFSDPVCQGPVTDTASLDEYLESRAAFIAEDYHVPLDECLERLQAEYQALNKAKNYDKVFIWLEHDSYDQLILARLLEYFEDKSKRPASIQLINIDQFPGVKRFNGLGQLPPDALRILWNDFQEVTEAQFTLGKCAWQALKAGSPEALFEIALTQNSALPKMCKAIARHLKELPSTANGLSLVEELTLKILADKGSMNAARLFGSYTNQYEPLSFLGDLEYWDNLNRLADAPTPAIKMTKKITSPADDHPKNWQLELTEIGRQLLTNSIDWLDIAEEERWVGGIRIDPAHNTHWRVNRSSDQLSLEQC